MKNVFYFILKALFVLKIFKVLAWLLGHVEKWFAEKANRMLISKFMTSLTGKHEITIDMLPNISKKSGNEILLANRL